LTIVSPLFLPHYPASDAVTVDCIPLWKVNQQKPNLTPIKRKSSTVQQHTTVAGYVCFCCLGNLTVFFFLFMVLRIELVTSCLLDRALAFEPHTPLLLSYVDDLCQMAKGLQHT
jgi:hypothetical protein